MKPLIEHLLTPADASFRYMRSKHDSFNFTWHSHRDYELTLILKGKGRRFVGDNISDFNPGDLIFTGPGLPHTWYSENKCETILIQFKGNFLGEEFFSLPELSPLKMFFHKASRGLAFDVATVKVVEKMMRKMEKLSSVKRILLLLEILDTLASSNAYTALSTKQFSMHLQGAKEKRIDKVCTYINENYLESMNLQQISKVASMSSQAFCRFFKHSTGKVFNDYLSELRIAHASMLLIETDKSVSEVCFESGFNNLSNFNRRFSRLKGMSPRQYRNEYSEK